MESLHVYVLISLGLGKQGEVTRTIAGVTFNIHDAEKHASAHYQNEYETHSVDGDWKQDVEVSALTTAMRDFRGMVEEMQRDALR
jgi:hypothetical protein